MIPPRTNAVRLVDRATGQVRVGDAEREAAVAALGEHYVAGRLTAEEHDQRISQAFAARVEADLWPLFRDLPPLQAPRPARRPTWRPGLGLAPVLLVVIALVVLTHLPLPLLLLVGWLWWGRVFRRWPGGPWHRTGSSYSSGSRRAVRGTWA